MKAFARLEHGRWVIDCPLETCWDAQLAPPGSKRHRKCACVDYTVCTHGQPCGQAIEVVWPDNLEKGLAVLRLRPARANHNWLPGETVEQLIAENLEHGVAVP